MVQLGLDSFGVDKKLTNKDRINITLSNSLRLKDCSDDSVIDIMKVILADYVMGKGGVFYLKDEKCKSCKINLKRKDVVDKIYILPGGHQMILRFMRYSCIHCKKTPGKPYEQVFEKYKHYSSNIKNDAVYKYLNHMSSYSAVKQDINKIYSSNIHRKTIRGWLNEIASESKNFIFGNNDFSGHLVYDEEFMSVFEGKVGIKDAKLVKKRLYFHLFRDALTNGVIGYLTDSMERDNLVSLWYKCFKHLIQIGVTPKTISTDGLSDYSEIIKIVNQKLIEEDLISKIEKVKHSYCAFHYQKNTYENVKKFLFGSQFKREKIPKYAINQIYEIHKFFEAKTIKEAEEKINSLLYQKNTFIQPVQNQIERVKKYFEEYTLHIQHPFLKTTNHAEQYFSNTNPEKIKKGFKTESGLKKMIQNMAVKMMKKNWLKALGRENDYSASMKLFTNLISGLKART
jgi:hypothetical protein